MLLLVTVERGGYGKECAVNAILYEESSNKIVDRNPRSTKNNEQEEETEAAN